MANQDIVNTFFDAYGKHDLDGIKQVMADDVTWTFLGQHPLAGVKHGIDEVVAFFDAMGKIMGASELTAEKLVIGSNDSYLIECQHIQTHREDSNNIDHHVCVLWTFANDKITSGRHFFVDPQALNEFFTDYTLMEVNKSRAEIKSGIGKELRSLKDLR